MQIPEFSEKSRLALTGKRSKSQIIALLAALSSLFEKGFSVKFSQPFYQMPHQFASRHSLLGASPHQIEPAVHQKSGSQPTFVVDQPLCDFLDLHRIEGRRVLPGVAMVDLFSRSSNAKTVKTFRFHLPLVLETPDTQVCPEIDAQGSYSLVQNNSAGTKICSGAIAETIAVRTPKRLEKEPEVVLHSPSIAPALPALKA